MIERKAYAKINLALDVLRKREDGYHEVRMIMQTVGIHDILTFEENLMPEKLTNGHAAGDLLISLNISDAAADLGPIEKNLVYRAARLVYDKYQIKTPVTITLKKHIPVAAGMAGGSTDAAAVFHGLNDLFGLNMSLEEMCSLGVKIGADVPYCIMGGTALSEGIGEKLTPICHVPQACILIAKPQIDVSTKFVYENLRADELKDHPDVDGMIRAIEMQDIIAMSGLLGNVLETVTIKEYPVIDEIKQLMKEAGALNALMSGSGPTVFGIFESKDKEAAQKAAERIKERGLAGEVAVTEFF